MCSAIPKWTVLRLFASADRSFVRSQSKQTSGVRSLFQICNFLPKLLLISWLALEMHEQLQRPQL